MTEKKEPGDDTAAFRAAMRGVRPIAAPAPAPGAGAARKKPTRVRAGPRADATPAAPPAILESGAHIPEQLAFQRPGVRDGQMRQLRRGLLQIEDELDLHGLTQLRAHHLFSAFLEECRDRGLRCVRIIHGRGTRSGARGPVLKAAVDAWLRGRHEVIAFTSARPRDGGAGALYVLLRA